MLIRVCCLIGVRFVRASVVSCFCLFVGWCNVVFVRVVVFVCGYVCLCLVSVCWFRCVVCVFMCVGVVVVYIYIYIWGEGCV